MPSPVNALDTDSVHRLDSTLLISGDDSTDSAYWGSSGSSISQMSDTGGGANT